MKDKVSFGYGHDKCNFCHKIKDSLHTAEVVKITKFRSQSTVNSEADMFRVVMDFKFKPNQALYRKLKNRIDNE